MNSKEYQSAGAWEGWAHFVAAVAFNNLADDDCRFRYYKSIILNFDPVHCAGPQPPPECQPEQNINFDCKGTENPPLDTISNADYLGHQCLGPLAHHATEYDWMRFWWNLNTEHAVSLQSIGAIWNGSNPHLWAARIAGQGDDVGKYSPCAWLGSAAWWEGVQPTFHDLAVQQGVHR